MRRGTLHLLVAVALVVVTGSAAADDAVPPDPAPEREVLPMPTPHLRLLNGPGVLEAPNGKLYALPQGSHILDGTTWSKIDSDLVNLQDDKTRLTTENQALRKATAGWQPGWRTLLVTLGSGLALGWYVHDKL